MKDLELIKMAAKAARINLHAWGSPGQENFADMDSQPYGKLWNPLKDDGDAMRLAAYLFLNIEFLGDIDGDGVFEVSVYPWNNAKNNTEYRGIDRAQIARCAIVRAAAEIGKKCHDIRPTSQA